MESIRVKNYSYEALEEFISNAIYHRSYQIHEPVTIRIEKECIEITSTPGPDRSITDDDLMKLHMRSRRYRNRRIGDFLKELHLVEGRNTGIPTALRSIEANGSPLPEFLTDDDRSFFTVILPIHESFRTITFKKKTRRTKEELREEILNALEENDYSERALYESLGYSGNPSKTFRECIKNMIKEPTIAYNGSGIRSPNSVLTKIKKNRVE